MSLVDDRWLAAPGLWAWIALVVIGLFGLGVPISTAHKRADLVHHPISGELVDIYNKRSAEIGSDIAPYSGGAILVTMFGCLYGLSNRGYNAASLLGLSHLQETPAKLIDCQHRQMGQHEQPFVRAHGEVSQVEGPCHGPSISSTRL